MMLNNWVQQLLADIERLTLGYESVILAVTVLIGLVTIIFFIVVWSYVDPYEKAINELQTQNRQYPLASLFVAVRNDEKLILDCVESMIGQTYKKREIFVIDDASEDNTANILRENFEDNPEVNLIYLRENVGKKKALAKAIEKSKGEIFAFTDSDSIWEKDAIEKIVTIFENEPGVGEISGHCNATNAETNILTRIQDLWYEKQYRLRKGFDSVFGSVSCVSGPLACYRRAAVYNYIPKWENDTFLGKEFRFATDRTMTGFVLGGSTLGPKIKENYSESSFVKDEQYPNKNWNIVYSRSTRVKTMVPETLSRIISQRIRWNKSFIRNIFFTGKFYWQRPLIPALYYYLHILYVFAAPILIIWFIGTLLLNNYLLLLTVAFMGYVLLSPLMNLALTREKRWRLESVLNLIYQLFLPFLLLYSLVTIRNMDWSSTKPKEVQ